MQLVLQQHPAWEQQPHAAECFSQHDQRQKPIDLARNVMVTKALQDKCELIFFLDSDILVSHQLGYSFAYCQGRRCGTHTDPIYRSTDV
jgi:hypothetical protein